MNWFKDLNRTNKSSFFKLDIESFYPSISKELLVKAIRWARTVTNVSQEEERIILHCRKSFLFWNGQAWEKRVYDVVVGATSKVGESTCGC